MHHSDRLISQGELTQHIYSQSSDRDSNTVEVFIARLRRKLGPSFIETVRGLGSRMKVDSWTGSILYAGASSGCFSNFDTGVPLMTEPTMIMPLPKVS